MGTRQTSKSARVEKYLHSLGSIPAPGGNGCHVALLGVANRGVLAGLTPDEIFDDLRRAIPRGRRSVSDREVTDAINRAFKDHAAAPVHVSKPKRFLKDGSAILRRLIEQGRGATEAEVRKTSPIPIDWMLGSDPVHVLPYLYSADDLLFIGERHVPGVLGETIRRCSEWREYFSQGGKTVPHIIPNPLTGEPTPKKSKDGLTCRGDGNVATFRFCVVEFDSLFREDQLAFWAVVDLPVAALIDSGGKSIHAWLDVRQLADISTLDAWNRHIKDRLYAQNLVPLGADSACSNPARLSRLPGHFRTEKRRWQKILYLSPRGRRVF